MEINQYLTHKQREDQDMATADLDAYVEEFLKEREPQQAIKFEDILLEDEPNNTVTTHTSFQDISNLLDRYVARPAIVNAVREAEKIEAKATNIDNFIEHGKLAFKNPELNKYFTIKQPKITAVIDWLALEFSVNRSEFTFSHPDKPFQDIRKLMKDHGIDPNIYVVQSPKDASKFTVHLHDIVTGNQLQKVADLLHTEYGANPNDMWITTLELSLDFWHRSSRPLLLALSKSVRTNESVIDQDFRVYKTEKLPNGNKKKLYGVMPKDPRKALRYINKGYTIGIGHRSNDDVYIRLYFKMTDRDNDLPLNQHRMRIEVNLKGQTLADMGNGVDNLRTLITEGFKYLNFTRLDDKATAEEKDRYSNKVELFGRETTIISKSRNKRKLPEFIKSHRELNDVTRKAIYNLSRHF